MPALLTTTQSRWLLSLLVGLLSAIAIASSAPAIAGGKSLLSMFSADEMREGLVLIENQGNPCILVDRGI